MQLILSDDINNFRVTTANNLCVACLYTNKLVKECTKFLFGFKILVGKNFPAKIDDVVHVCEVTSVTSHDVMN